MEVNDQTLGVLRGLLQEILSVDNNARKNAEAYLKTHEAQPGFPLLILTLITRLASSVSPQDIAIRQSASVLFKNVVKNHWQPEEDDAVSISHSDKGTIKTHVVELMTTASIDVQKQLAEAVSMISKYDFPDNWNNLLSQLVEKLNKNDLMVTKGVMLTANSIMKRFRYVMKSDELYLQIKKCLDEFAIPLLTQYKLANSLVLQFANNKAELSTVFESIRLMTRIFFSLNWQDIPEFFEDNVNPWMTEFAFYLSYKNPLLIDNSEDNEPGPIEKVQAAILENLNIYATKYEEVFEPFLPQFTQLVWKLLMEISSKPKYDLLATGAIKFLSAVASKQLNVGLFSEAVLRDIVEHIVVKNLMATEADEELFEDNPFDYIRKDMEGSDQDTRRRSAMELVRSLMKFFAPQVSQLCTGYIRAMLDNYQSSMDWRSKDAALHLILAVAVKSANPIHGATELNPEINILSIFDSHILPEINDPNVNRNPLIKADCIKMVCLFRPHLQTPFLISIFPNIIRLLGSESIVVHTYAALCIERFLSIKDKDASGVLHERLPKNELMVFFQPLFDSLFKILGNPEVTENEYVMKCIMRSLVIIGNDITPVTQLVISHLTKALEKVCKNPVNPLYNHYLFESLALLVKASCGNASGVVTDAQLSCCAQLEGLLFPSFQFILAQDISEFIPYVFQILAQLLCARPVNSGLSDSYRALFPPLLSPLIWERKGNIPGLTDLVKAYISRGFNEMAAGSNLTGVLGVFQKLLASKSSEVYAFGILNSLYSYAPINVISPFLNTIFSLLLHRMQESAKISKTAAYSRLFIHNLCLFSTTYGSKLLYDTLESLTNGLIAMVVLNIWSVNHTQCANLDKLEIKTMLIGGTKLLTETPITQRSDIWGNLFKSLLALCHDDNKSNNKFLKEFELEDDESREFDTSYSKLTFAALPTSDAAPEIPSGQVYFLQTVSKFTQDHPSLYSGLIQSMLSEEEKLFLQQKLQVNGLSLK